MPFWKRAPVEPVVVEVEPEGMTADRVVEGPEEPQTEGVWQHLVAFGSDGWFHPVVQDEHGEEIGPDLTRKLIHNSVAGEWEFAKPEHRAHKEFQELRHGGGEIIIEIGEQAQ